jgi:hypothetical protein
MYWKHNGVERKHTKNGFTKIFLYTNTERGFSFSLFVNDYSIHFQFSKSLIAIHFCQDRIRKGIDLYFHFPVFIQKCFSRIW